ncbi:PAS domain S-box-containing protein/diguanylate cyclase (GGDEF) domain-containing protein [Rhodoferax sp. OV413]|uniref:putative bifunctional diguanylate cyclase/phosphodiesterase n=1 Tax=Rhodoferax sp. OV413 TaxID=1855285 RepID=UPI00088814CF|nr:PAS domain S-box-containing protein/diguanylate cyclase (GGDEF) domain-containing protein [Rhodoferax sp. OV413]
MSSPGGRLSSLSVGIVVAMAAGLFVPALIGVMTLSYLRQAQINKELSAYLDERASQLSNSLAVPVWNYNTIGVSTIGQSALLDPQVVRITVSDSDKVPIVVLEQPQRRLGKSQVVQRPLLMRSAGTEEVAGFVEIEVDDGLKQQEFARDRRAYAFILLGQFVLSLGCILVALHLRVLRPLHRLTLFSNRLAGGNFEQPIGWERPDEIGRLAQQMDRMRKDLKTSFAEQQVILSNVQVGVLFVRDGRLHIANHHAEQIFGYGPGAMAGLPASTLYPQGGPAAEGGPDEELRFLQRQDGTQFWAQVRKRGLDPQQPQAGSIWVIEDFTARKAAEDEINSLAFYDPLTLLPNRRLLMDRLKHALVASARSGKCGALLFIDLDHFKTLNDTLGHDKGDLLLQQVAQRLVTCVREGDTVARLGGDEFVVILEDLGGNPDEVATHCRAVGEKIFNALNLSYPLAGHDVRSTPSIGVTLFDGPRNSIDELLKQADLAMYQAKTAGRNTLRFFDAAMQAAVSERAVLESDLREALRLQQFVLHYQPQVVGQRQITGAEVLLRWQHPRRGMVGPADFIPLAEETGLILPLGHWVLQTACAQLALWALRPETAELSIAVNVSAKQMQQEDFVAQVLAVLRDSGAQPRKLKLELTESVLVDDVEATIRKMDALKSSGVGFSLDDFGTGYSSLTYLKRLPLDQLKIDQGFIKDILVDPNDAAIARMVIALAESLGLCVIAEGVEEEAQRLFLAHSGCHAYQGYLMARPQPIAEFEAILGQP